MAAEFSDPTEAENGVLYEKATKYGVKILNGKFAKMKKYFRSNYKFKTNIETFVQKAHVQLELRSCV